MIVILDFFQEKKTTQLRGEPKRFSNTKVFDKILHYTKTFLLKNPIFMFLANFIFVVSHLQIHSAVHLNTSKTLM